MKRVRVSVAAKIEKNFVFTIRGATHVGRKGDEEVASQLTSDRLQIFMTDDTVDDTCPSDELIKIIMDHCKIDTKHEGVLRTTLTQNNIKKLLEYFRKRGIHVGDVTVEGT